MPMRHERLIVAVIAAKLGEIVSVMLSGSEQRGEARNAGIDRIANDVDDACIRQSEVNQSCQEKVLWHLVSHTPGIRCELSQFGNVSCAHLPEYFVGGGRNEIGIGRSDGSFRSAHGADEPDQCLVFTTAVHVPMAGENLLDQRGS